MTPQMKRMLWMTGLVFGVIFTIYAGKRILFTIGMSYYQAPAITISATKANLKTWQSFLNSVGTLTAVNGTDISSEVSGIVKEIRFNSGQFVNANQLLVLLNTDIEQAQLKNDEARVKLAQINYDRNHTLVNKKVLSQAAFDISVAELQEAQAALEGTQAKIKQKTITAPFAGKIGISNINIGDYVSAGTSMVTLQALDPLYVQFNLPEQYLPSLYLQQAIEITINGGSNKAQTFKGIITAINSKVDQTTRNILVQATIPNKDMNLYPGMFAQVKVWLRAENNVVTLPQTAISYSLHGDSVFLIKEDISKRPGKIYHFFHYFSSKENEPKPVLRVVRQYVKVGELRGDEAAILEGIKTGDQVVTSGQLKLQNNTLVVIDNTVEL